MGALAAGATAGGAVRRGRAVLGVPGGEVDRDGAGQRAGDARASRSAIWAIGRASGGASSASALGVAAVLEGLARCCSCVYLLDPWPAVADCGRRLAPRRYLSRLAAMVGRPGDALRWASTSRPRSRRARCSAYNQSIVGALARLTSAPSGLQCCGSRPRRLVPARLRGVGRSTGRAVAHAAAASHSTCSSSASSCCVVLLAGPLTLGPLPRLGAGPRQCCCATSPAGSGSGSATGVAVAAGLGVAVWLLYHGVADPAARRRSRPTGSMRLCDGPVHGRDADSWLGRSAGGSSPVRRSRRSATPEWPDDARGAAVGAAREVVAGGVHRRG